LDEIITAGRSGMVFKAWDTEGNRPAAVKVLTPNVADSEEQKERFVRAMKTMMPIRHPNIVQLYNAGKKGPYCWAAMEYVEGESLASVIDQIGVQGMLDWRDVWRVAVHIGRALREGYERKIIHRNVTPTNILRRDQGSVYLLGDLMLAKALEGSLAKQVTQPGQVIGDVPYMPPERTRDGAAVDGRADIYGLGATCYALLTGHPPYESDSLPEMIRMIRNDTPKKPKDYQMSINEMFQDLVLQMLAKDPDDRFATPSALLRDLERIGKFNSLEADWDAWAG
jgi:serine/threonine protein kinase